jgi:hypothetical protein
MYCGDPRTKPVVVVAHLDIHRRRARAPVVVAHRSCDSEIREQRLLLLGDENVIRLHVAVHVTCTVRVLQSAGHLARDAQRIGQRELRLAGQPRAERFAGHVRHRIPEKVAAGVAVIQHGKDVGMLEPRRDRHFVSKPLRADALRDLRMQHLERHETIGPRLPREEYRGHSASGQLVLHLVRVTESGL